MNAVYYGQHQERTETNILPFPKAGTKAMSSGATYPGGYGLGGLAPDAIAEAAAMIQAVVTQHVMERQLRQTASPFDAVYISALQMDTVDYANIQRLRGYMIIQDASDEIDFDDGMA